MNKLRIIFQLYFLIHVLSSFEVKKEKTFTLTVKVNDLRNSVGIVQFALYNSAGSLPDEHFKNYYRKGTAFIANGSSEISFKNLMPGKYAVNVLHDEDVDGKIKKGFILPREGIGFSNYQSINLFNKPAFSKASFVLSGNQNMNVKIIYM